jgi:5'(3')-deoxyribonucleotidase
VTAPRRLAVAVDLDDVCGDRLGIIASMLLAEGKAIRHRHPADWSLREWGVRDQADYDRLHYAAFVDGRGYRSMTILPGAAEGLAALHQQGFIIRVVTGRLWNSQVIGQALADTGYWLADHALPVDDVAFVSDKVAVKADLYVEDAPHFIADLQDAGRQVIVMDTRYNRHLPGSRAASWQDVLRLVPRLLPGSPAAERQPGGEEGALCP